MAEYLKSDPKIRLLPADGACHLLNIQQTVSNPGKQGQLLQLIADVADERGSFLATASTLVDVPPGGRGNAALQPAVSSPPQGYTLRIFVRKNGVTLETRCMQPLHLHTDRSDNT